MLNIQLLSLDLDGTLLNSQRRISDENINALMKAKSKGVKIVINTGRPLVSTLEYLSLLNLYGSNEYSITYNGGLVQKNDGTILSKKLLSYEEVEQIAAMARKRDFPCDIISDDSSYTIEFGRKSKLSYVNNTLSFQKISLDQLPQKAEFNKVIISAESIELDRLQNEIDTDFLNSFEVFRTAPVLLEVMPKGVSKATGLEKLCEYLEIPAAAVLAMGDEANDAPMLRWAGLGIAPANAKKVAQEAADKISDFSNDEDTIAEALKTFVL
ncbi:MAG: Cof-type HAD-IIB family hydrolase [Streptococcaceae bacterium]|jgi:Cof subfamily protein (haloacid dehalogenase superfamily)|nr:Cof-type HAD-IIB family hydrolase [Streptococcaceae bacterium]